MTKGQTHYNQQITTKTKKLLEKLCQRSKLSNPMQLEMIVEITYNKIITLIKWRQFLLSYLLLKFNLERMGGGVCLELISQWRNC